MLYSAVFASASGEFGTRDRLRGVRDLNADNESCSGASDADMNPGVLDTTGVTRGLFRPVSHPLDTITTVLCCRFALSFCNGLMTELDHRYRITDNGEPRRRGLAVVGYPLSVIQYQKTPSGEA